MAKKLYDWDRADKETRKLWVRVLREDEHSDEVIADFFAVTKGTIVGFRHRYLPELTFGKKASRPHVNPERFRDLLELAAMRRLEQENGNVTAIAPVSADAHPEPVTECQWPVPGRSLKETSVCSEPVTTPGEKLCDTHLAIVKTPR